METQTSLFEFEDISKEEILSLDELFRRSIHFRTSAKYQNLLKFVRKFKKYSIYNNCLVFLQNPEVTYYATASHWYKEFQRKVKENARSMVILAPMTPILFVYDISDTEGPPLPDSLLNPFETTGELGLRVLNLTIDNCLRDKIRVITRKMNPLSAGCTFRYLFTEKSQTAHKSKVEIEINSSFSQNEMYSTICHEIAHIYLGHLGNDADEWWPDRRRLNDRVKEIEVESVSFLVCGRYGLKTKSDEYISDHINNEADIQSISIETIMKVAAMIEKMGKQKLPERKA
jgi:hypothetical protein